MTFGERNEDWPLTEAPFVVLAFTRRLIKELNEGGVDRSQAFFLTLLFKVGRSPLERLCQNRGEFLARRIRLIT